MGEREWECVERVWEGGRGRFAPPIKALHVRIGEKSKGVVLL